MRKVTGRCDIGKDVDCSTKDEEDLSFSEWMEQNVIRELQNHSGWWDEGNNTGGAKGKSYAQQYGHYDCDEGYHSGDGEDVEDYAEHSCGKLANPGANLKDCVDKWVTSLESAVDFDDAGCGGGMDSEGSSDWF